MNGTLILNSTDETKKHVRAIIMTNSTYLSKEGNSLKAKAVALKNFYSSLQPKTKDPKGYAATMAVHATQQKPL